MSMIEVLKQYDLDSDGYITPEEFEFSVILSGGSMDDAGTASMKDMIEVFADEYGRVPIRKVAKFYKILDELNAAKEGSPEKLQALRKLLKSFDENGDRKLCQTEAKMALKESIPGMVKWIGYLTNCKVGTEKCPLKVNK